jgi:hypothetical protein
MQSNPNAGTLTTPEGLESQLSDGIHRISVEIPHSGELELKNSIKLKEFQ